MAMNTANVTIVGNLTRDPREFADGRVCRFDVAVNSWVKGLEGEWGDHTSFYCVVVFGERPVGRAMGLVKGRKVCVSGAQLIKRREHEGRTYVDVEIEARHVEDLGGRENGERGGAPSGAAAARADQARSGVGLGEGWEGESPF